MTEENRHYYAFISYSHKDEKEVLSLHNFWEHYSIPKEVRAIRPNAPKRFSPIFIDQDNLSGTNLDDRLKQALRNSDFLIVICSPASSGSSYVNQEVSYFISLGRQNHIIPYILDGVPNSQNPEQECYVAPLRMLNPLGANKQELGKRKAELRVLASMLDVDLDLLVQKDKQRRIQKSICAAVITAAVGIGAWIPFDYYKIPKTACYEDYVEVNGIPQGIGKALSTRQRKDFQGTYAITKLGGKVRSLEYVNIAGNAEDPVVQTGKEEAAIREYTYDDEGMLSEIVLKDKEGKTLASRDYSNHCQEVSLRAATGNTVSLNNFNLLISDGAIENNKTNGVTAFRMIYDEETGYLEKKIFTAFAGSQASKPDDLGTYGREYEYTGDGQLYRMYYLDSNGEKMSRKSGAAYIEYTYDEQGRVLSQTFYDSDGNRADGGDSLSQLAVTYSGSVITFMAYDAEGNLTENPANGTEQCITVNNEEGNPVEIAYYDAEGNLKSSSSGYAKCTMGYDSDGHQNSAAYWDENDEAFALNGAYSLTKEYSENNGETTVLEKYYDANGDIAANEDGYAMLKQVTDASGNVLVIEYYDANGDPAAGKEGYFRVEAEINAAGYKAKESYYSVDGSPYLLDGYYTSTSREYDSQGNCTDLYYLDGDGNLICNAKGYAHIAAEYNLWGNRTEVRYYDQDGNLVNAAGGFAKLTCEYDENGNVSSGAYFDDQENPMITEDGYHKISFTYENGRITEYSYYGKEDEPILREGAHKIVMERDPEGNVTGVYYYGIYSQSVLCDDGYFREKETYDASGNLLSCKYYDLQGNLTVNKALEDVAGFEFVYDDKGNKIQYSTWKLKEDGIYERETIDLVKKVPVSYEYYYADGTAAADNDLEMNNVHRVEYLSDEEGNLTGIIFYDAAGSILYEGHEN